MPEGWTAATCVSRHILEVITEETKLKHLEKFQEYYRNE
jgi:hypothetical protein